MKFGAFDFDPATGSLLRDGAPVALSHRGIALLRVLALRRGDVVTKNELLDAA